ncbi:MAG: BMP family ABC transporter substrate-binding protein [Desulfobacterales bacterium]|nr:BMP family ABC transporter substrate-binding protein [Desulfobacterales bacterium]
MRLSKASIWLIVFLLFIPVQVNSKNIGFLTGSGGLGDESFNDATYKGMAKAVKEFNHKLIVREWEQEKDMDQLFLGLVNSNADQIVLNGDQFLPLTENYADRFPTVKIIANDFYGGNYPNVKSIIYGQHEGSFLAGALAGWFTRSGKVGFIGAIDIDVIQAFLVGFNEGVAYASPNVDVAVEFISKLPDYSGFNDPSKASRLAKKMYDNNVDVIFAVAGLSGNGVIRTASIEKKYVIGVDRDQDHMAKGYVLTSVIKQLDHAVYQELAKVQKGGFTPGTISYSLGNGGIRLSEMKYTKHIIPAFILENLQKIKKDIISGTIKVTNFLEPESGRD